MGGGISGIACAGALSARGFDVEVRDRGRVIGGRMASKRLRGTGTDLDGRVVDYGASYFTTRDLGFVAVVESLMAAGIVEEWTDGFHVSEPQGMAGMRVGPMRYRAPRGLRSMVEALADRLEGVTIRRETTVESIRSRASNVVVDGDEFDVVAVCMPGPQAARILTGTNAPAELTSLTWEPVIAVTMVFDERTWGEIDGVFVNDDPAITWIADDGRRRGDNAPVLVAHVHPVLSARHLDDPASVIPAAIASTNRALGLTEPPAWVEAHRWTLAKPMTAYVEPYVLLAGSRVGFAGDGFAGGPRIEAAWISGNSLGGALFG